MFHLVDSYEGLTTGPNEVKTPNLCLAQRRHEVYKERPDEEESKIKS